MLYFVVVFVEVRILIFHVLFISLFFSCLYRDRPFFCAECKFVFVCVCAWFPFLWCWVLLVIKEGKGKMLYFVVVFVEVRILIFHVLFLSLFFSCIYRDRPFFCAGGKFVFVCVCAWFPFLWCWVLFVIKEGKGRVWCHFCFFCCSNINFPCYLFVRVNLISSSSSH